MSLDVLWNLCFLWCSVIYFFVGGGQRKRVDIYVLLRVILLVRYPVLTHQDHFVFYKNVIQFIRSMYPRFIYL